MATSDSFYIEIKEEVDSILDEFGTTFTIKKAGTYSSTELSVSEGTTRIVTGVVADQTFSLKLANSLAVEWDSKKTLILKAAAAPLTNESVLVDEKWYPLSEAKPIKPADIIVVYFLDLTR